MNDLDALRLSWNQATANHNRHKGDQAQRLRQGEELLFPEELDLLGPLDGRTLVHLQCNAGQDSLCLARRGADVLGVDLSDHAIAFATQLATDGAIPARFVHDDVVHWLHRTPERFDLAFTSYGTTGWLPDLDAWAAGVHRVLKPGGALVYVEFHPLVWSIGADLRLSRDDYFQTEPFRDPVGDYVAEAGPALGAVDPQKPGTNDIAAPSWQHGLADIVQAVVGAGLRLDRLEEYPHSNGCRSVPALVEAPGRRWVWPEGTARVPLMFGLRARRP